MIRKIKKQDEYEFYKLGQILNPKFSKLFDLDTEISSAYKFIYVYELNNSIVGLIHIAISYSSADIINIIVDKKYQHQGIGTQLINYVIKNHNLKEINIEVRVSNPAILFYKKNDFKIIRTIKKYYGNEDAYFMKKEIVWIITF